MTTPQVYFKNHNKPNKFPWSIYHGPLIKNLILFLKSVPLNRKKILIIGPGEFQEFEILIGLGFEISILDIDQRVIVQLQERYSTYITQSFLVDEHFNNYPEGELFDTIYAKEVIEHFKDSKSFLRKINKNLKPDGTIWLSTPNYGFFLLPLIEKYILELIARLSGFSRKDIHPTKYSKSKLEEDLTESGFNGIIIHYTKFKLALVAIAKKKV